MNTDHYKDKPLGVLDEQESQKFLDILDRLQETEEKLYHFVKVRIEHEAEREKRQALEKLQAMHDEDNSIQQDRANQSAV